MKDTQTNLVLQGDKLTWRIIQVIGIILVVVAIWKLI